MKKIAVYCRVSTDKEDQVNSLANQEYYFRDYIRRQPQWELWQVYADEGISGTSTKKRHAFQQMLADAEKGCFDLIITKEISRFARNTLDSIFYTRKLKELGVGVFFLNDNINTLEADAELRLTIMASIAQEESRKTSDRVKWGQKRRMEQGVVFGRSLLGYDVKDGKISINPAGAEIVRQIFHEFVYQGKGSHMIAEELRAAGIQTANQTKTWSDTAILRILQNEKYTGDLVQKKTYTPNYLNHEKKYNKGAEELVICRQHHPAIISQELFQAAKAELARRRKKQNTKGRHSGRYCFSGKIQCGYCGATFTPRQKKRKDGSIYLAWRCSQAAQGRIHPGTCGKQISHEALLDLMAQTLQGLSWDQQTILKELKKTIILLMKHNSSENQHRKLQKQQQDLKNKREHLLELYITKEITQKEFREFQAKYDGEAEAASKKLELIHCFDASTTTEKIQEIIEGILSGEIPNETFYGGILDKIVMQEDGIAQVYLRYATSPYIFRLSP